MLLNFFSRLYIRRITGWRSSHDRWFLRLLQPIIREVHAEHLVLDPLRIRGCIIELLDQVLDDLLSLLDFVYNLQSLRLLLQTHLFIDVHLQVLLQVLQVILLTSLCLASRDVALRVDVEIGPRFFKLELILIAGWSEWLWTSLIIRFLRVHRLAIRGEWARENRFGVLRLLDDKLCSRMVVVLNIDYYVRNLYE